MLCATKFIDGSKNWRNDILTIHQNSQNHKDAMAAKLAKQQPQQTTMAIINRWLTVAQHDKFSFLFNTAYAVAKQNWSFRDFVTLCELQVKSGINLGDNYLTHQAARDFVESFAREQHQDTIRELSHSCFFSVKADGSTDHSINEQESVYILYMKDGKAVSKFVGL